LRLLHHFTTVTSYTISGNSQLRTLWRIDVPRLAFDHTFLMRGIFVLSALHLASISKNDQDRESYLAIATHEQHLALPEATALLSNITQDNCSAVYAFSIITFISKWAAPRNPKDTLLEGGTAISEWLTLFRGIRSIGESFMAILMDGPMGVAVRQGQRRFVLTEEMKHSPWWAKTLEHAKLEQLRRNIMNSIRDKESLQLYLDAINDLEPCFCSLAVADEEVDLDQDTSLPRKHSILRQRQPEVSGIYAWLYKASDRYLELLSGGDQEALVIFAHFCAVLHFLDGYWWMRGWSTHLINTVDELLQSDYKFWIQWPVEVIGYAAA
jgi:hypothetical protein